MLAHATGVVDRYFNGLLEAQVGTQYLLLCPMHNIEKLAHLPNHWYD